MNMIISFALQTLNNKYMPMLLFSRHSQSHCRKDYCFLFFFFKCKKKNVSGSNLDIYGIHQLDWHFIMYVCNCSV